jgi:hypothetical protein
MKQKLLLLFLPVFFVSGLFAQEPDKQSKENNKNTYDGFQIVYGAKILANGFQGQLNTLHYSKPGMPLQFIGVGFDDGELAINRSYSTSYGHVRYSQFIPQEIKVNDTISCRVTGGFYSAAYGETLGKKALRMNFYTGFNWGRLRLSGNPLVREQNWFFSPKGGLALSLRVKKIGIKIAGEAEYDVTGTHWKKLLFSKADFAKTDHLRQESISLLTGISYYFD